ncbi:S-layer homology domain-containing protein [Cohnella fermenti]|uniref:S-layer homology domain-containing protein n=1 Tax=Cohnella fermenti TaxID=2565925 RepID=UPI001E2AB888|nr:S-layer homology domain-containing protein [Cohnella fermenti]
MLLRSYTSIELILSKSEGTVAFDSAAYSVSEDGGSAIVTIVRSDSYGPTTVRLTTTDGSATAGTDYTAVTDTISFLAGETVKTYPIPIDDNAVYSGNRMFTATLSDPSNMVSLGAQSSASITIMEDELPDTTAPTVDVTKFTAIDNYDGTPDQLLGSANAIGESGANVRAYAWNDANDDNAIDAGELSATGVDLGTSAADGSVSAADLGDLPPGSYKYVLTATDAAGNESLRVVSAAISVILSKAAMPQDSEISPTTATFDINPANRSDVTTEMTLNGNTLTGIVNGGSPLVEDEDYTVVDDTVTIGQSYLAEQPVGSTTLTFTFSAGSEQTLVITVSDSTPTTYGVIYDGNTSDGGTAPTETNKASGATFAAKANTFTKTGYTFSGWNTEADGEGTAYAEGATVTMPTAALTLYAQWSAIPTYAISPLSNETLNALTAGYASGTQDTITVTVTQTGTGDLTALATTLSGTNASSFTITQPVATTLNSGMPSTTFTLKPNDGLAAGTYTATVTVSATHMTPVTFTVTQVVNRADSGSSTSSNTTVDLVIDLNGTRLDPDTIDTTKPSVTLQVTPKDGVAYVSIPGSLLTRFAGQNATFFIEIQAPYGSYRVPVNLASLVPGLQDLLAANKLNAEDISFKITLTDKSGDADIQAAFARGLPNGKVMGAIVDFSIEIINTKTKQPVGAADKFSKAMVRIIPMPKEMTDLPDQWGAFRYNETAKQFEFVPARKVQIEGNWYVMISSLSNSVYVVADNSVYFTDVRQDWSQPFIDLAAAKGLVNGVGGGLYDPNKEVTRAEFAAMLVRALGRGHSTNTAAPYEDVKQGAWYYSEVAQAKELGLLAFASSNRFKPEQVLTREEMASMLAAAIELEKLPSTGEKVSLNGYKDMGRIDPIYMEDVRLMVSLNIMNGTSKDTFSPEGETTRAQAAAVLVRALRVLGFIDQLNHP